jgi:hypothetical protein
VNTVDIVVPRPFRHDDAAGALLSSLFRVGSGTFATGTDNDG